MMNYPSDYVGADGQSYPKVASRAVMNAQQQSPSPIYGYLRTGTQQKIYLFNTIEDGHGWLVTLTHGQAQPYDYVAVFAATDLSRPVPGLESYGHTTVSGCPQIGGVLPFLLGLPAGAVAGYFLRRWQEENPGHALPGVLPGVLTAPKIPGASPPKTAGIGGPWLDMVGGPWVDMVGGPWLDVVGPTVGGPWVDMVGGPWLDVVGPTVGGPWVDMVGGPWHDVEEPSYTIGGPWVDVVGGPWVDVVGAQVDDRERMRAWPQTKALIQSAIREVGQAARQAPAEAYVWSLDPPNPHLEGAVYASDPSRYVELEGTSGVMSFASPAEALDYMRERIRTPHVALALFDRRSAHWPNPTNWSKSNATAYEPFIAQQIARFAPSRYVGAVPGQTTVGAAIDDVRSRAQVLANKRAGSVVGVIHTTKDGLWHALAFRDADDADDWLGTATQDPESYTYAAYYDKNDFQWPQPVNEKIGGPRVASKRGSSITRGPATTSGAWWAA